MDISKTDKRKGVLLYPPHLQRHDVAYASMHGMCKRTLAKEHDKNIVFESALMSTSKNRYLH